MPGLLLLAVCVATPVDARFALTIDGANVAVLRLTVTGHQYHYEAMHFLEGDDAVATRSFELDDGGLIDGLAPEALRLLTPLELGCRDVLEERRGARERLCVDRSTPTSAEGRLDGARFSARYADGRLVALELPGATWTPLEGTAPPKRTTSLFRDGFAVHAGAGAPHLEPRPVGARLVRQVRGSATPHDGLDQERCLSAARRAIAADPRATLVLGLVIEGARAFPHAWVRRPGGDDDPTLLPTDRERLGARHYLELPAGAAGRIYLELAGGTRRVEAAPSPTPTTGPR